MTSGHDVRWQGSLRRYVDWRAEHGSLPRASGSIPPDEKATAHWMMRQRRLAAAGDLSAERVAALDAALRQP